MTPQPVGEPPADALASGIVDEVARQRLDLRRQHRIAAHDPGDRHALPQQQRLLRRQGEGIVALALEGEQAGRRVLRQRAARGAEERAAGVEVLGGIGDEAEALDSADRMPLDDHLAAARHGREQLAAVLHLAHQHGVTAVDEALGE
jgi:hypothetical protein